MATNTNGIIYYKLDANIHGYPGDTTKNCGLRGEEIDGNFNFLHGNDIKSISFDDNGTMFLTKYNGEILTAKQADQPEYDFNYNPESGKLTIVTPDGKEITLDGFKITANTFHDYSLNGLGTQESPLGLSNIAKTGRYLPAIKLIDTTKKDENGNNIEMLPDASVNAKHDRYVTKETGSHFGLLYPLEGVKAISKRLEDISSEWRIPTKKDWDDMLNAIDCATPNHQETISNTDLGEIAGAALKSNKLWRSSDSGVILSDDAYGFTIYPVGYCGNRGTNYYGSFSEAAAFWTNTVEDNNDDMYVKVFKHNTETVWQYTWGTDYYLSIRLVKTNNGDNFEDTEDIDGHTVSCVQIPGSNTIWTRENINFTNEQYLGFKPELWNEYKEYSSEENVRYYINDWNGKGWDKYEIKEGESIVLRESPEGSMREWMLINSELTSNISLIKDELQYDIDNFGELLQKEIKERTDSDNTITEALKDECKTRESIDEKLQIAIDNEIATRQEYDTILKQEIERHELVPCNESITVIPGVVDSDRVIPTQIMVNLDASSMNLKLGETGIYFDGYFGKF